MPQISIIIPVYNVERYLCRCLDSVLHQTFTQWEAICVNDGSPDSSREILEQYRQRDQRVKVVDKENGGLSDARNVGMRHASGDYIMFLDSDDFIHPQTMEVAYHFAKKDDSDLVTWYKEPTYRIKTVIKRKLGFDVDHGFPRSYQRHYRLDTIKSVVTDNVFEHFTERSHSNISNPIKHFYVWRFLIRRSFVDDLPFIKGITFEDFPWTSALMLRMPRTTITQLPFLYYYPNIGSIDLSTKRARKINDWITGLEQTYQLYQSNADDYCRHRWQMNCMWPVVECHIAKHLSEIAEPELAQSLATRLANLQRQGVFAQPKGNKAQKAVRQIDQFVQQYSDQVQSNQ